MRTHPSSLHVVTTDELTREDITSIHTIEDDGVAVATPRPHRRKSRDAALQAALFESIGVSNDVSGTGRDVTADWHHLMVLFTQVEDLIVVDSHHLSPTKLRAVIQMAIVTDTSLWLLLHTQHYDTDQHTELAAWPMRRTPARRFLRQFAGRQHADSDVLGDERVRVPRSDFPTFRSDCLSMLNAEEFEQVDDRYRRAWQTTLELTADGTDLDEDDVAAWLRTQLDECATADQMQTVIRAIQATLFTAGWFLKVDLDAFLGAHDHVHTPAARDAETWRRLRAYRQTYRRAVCALAAARLSLDQMRTIQLRDVANDGATVEVAGTHVDTEPAAQSMLRNHITYQQSLGRHAEDLLLSDEAGQPLSDHQLKRAITEPLLEAGVALVNGRVVRRTPNPTSWMRRQGLSLTQL